jgi:hypothetical protein
MRPTTALLVTTLLGGGAFAFVVADSVSGGCRVAVEAHNLGRDPTWVDWRAATVPGPCDAERQYRIVVTEGDDTWSEPFTSATGWTPAATVHVDHWRATKRGGPSSG